jgi:hypothetical protein
LSWARTLGSAGGGYLSVVARPNNPALGAWLFVLIAPVESRLSPGTYATASVGTSFTTWQMDFNGDGRLCNRSVGRIVIHAIAVDRDLVFPEVNSLARVRTFRASFEIHCEGTPPVLRGEIAVVNG